GVGVVLRCIPGRPPGAGWQKLRKRNQTMQRDRRMRMLRRQAIIAFVEGFVAFFILLLVIITRNPDATNRAIPYTRTPGHIIIQLTELPEPNGAGSGMYAEQEWVLYGDG